MPRPEFTRGVSADLVGEKYNHLLALNGLRQGLWGVSSLGRRWEDTWGQGIAIQEEKRGVCAHLRWFVVSALTMKTLGGGKPYCGC